MIGEMFYTDIDGDVWQYELNTKPTEAVYWDTYKLKISNIKVLGDASKEIKKRVQHEIYRDIENVVPKS